MAATTLLIAKIEADIALANSFKCGSDNLQTLASNITIVKAWKSRLERFGLNTNVKDFKIIDGLPLDSIFYWSQTTTCGNIFNQSSTTSFSSAAIDELPTLDGAEPDATGVVVQNFYVVTCSSRICGIGWRRVFHNSKSGVWNHQSGWGCKQYVGKQVRLSHKFGYPPAPVVVVHMRFTESNDEKYAGYLSLGISGNLQGQASGGSTAEFLLGPSVSIFRTMFITPGVAYQAPNRPLCGGLPRW